MRMTGSSLWWVAGLAAAVMFASKAAGAAPMVPEPSPGIKLQADRNPERDRVSLFLLRSVEDDPDLEVGGEVEEAMLLVGGDVEYVAGTERHLLRRALEPARP
jgi:hypothetical protein